jgi:hypothetical protein
MSKRASGVVGRLLALSEVSLDLRNVGLRNTDLSGLSDDQVLREGANPLDVRRLICGRKLAELIREFDTIQSRRE